MAQDWSQRNQDRAYRDAQQTWLDSLSENGLDLLQILINSTVDLLFVKDREGVYRICNDAFCGYVGHNLSGIIGKRDDELFPDAASTAYQTLDRAVMDSDQTFSVEEWIQYPSGRRSLVHTTKSPVHDKTGQVVGVIGMSRDVTDRKRQEELVRLQNELGIQLNSTRDIQQAFQLALDVAIQVGGMDSGAIYQVNERNGLDLVCHQGLSASYLDRVRHYPADTAQAQYVSYNQPLYLSADMLQMTNRDTVEIEGLRSSALLPIANNQRVVACLNLSSHADQGFKAHECTAMESVARQLGAHLIRAWAEEELKRSERRLDLFFSQSLDGFFFMMLDEPVVWNPTVDKEAVLDYVFNHQRITRINKAMLDQYKARAEDFLGKTPQDFFEHDLEQGRAVWREFFDKGTLHIDTNERRFDGSVMYVEGDYICFYDEEGRITGHFGIQRDISEKVQALTQAIQSEQRYRVLFETIGDAVLIFEARPGEEARSLIEANRSACQTLGFSKSQLMELNCSQLFTSPHDVMHEAEKTGVVRETELLVRKADGSDVSCQARFCPLEWGEHPALMVVLKTMAQD